MTDLGALIDLRRKLSAELAGVQLQICMAVGDRDGAQRAQHEMYAQTEARQAAVWMEPCYFAEQGAAARRQETAKHA